MKRSSLALRALIASLVANAFLGIWALLRDDFGETETKIVVTSFLLTAAMLIVLVNTPAIRRRVIEPVPTVSAASGVAGVVVLGAAMWFDAGADWVYKLSGSLMLTCAAGSLLAALTMLTLRPAHRKLLMVDALAIAALWLTSLVTIWAERGGSAIARLIGVEAIVVATLTIMLPALARFAPDRPPTDEDAGAEVRYCPFCGAGVAAADRTNRCAQCTSEFRVELTAAVGRPLNR